MGAVIMYHYPIRNMDYFSKLLEVSPDEHTMGDSLQRYMQIKVHPLIDGSDYEKIIVQGKFDRTYGVSSKEKTGKLFNYMRPTARIEDSCLYLNCFPGIDYVFHYGNILKSYMALSGKHINISHILPSDEECWNIIAESELKHIPKPHTVIMGYVEGLDGISEEKVWQGKGNFLWKNVQLSTSQAILLGCKHTYWGEIAGRIVKFLALSGVKRVIYSGKLGTLDSKLMPNQAIATGNISVLPNGKVVEWNNLFGDITDSQVFHGTHVTVPSVLQETKVWLEKGKKSINFVDPEIGHMALSAHESGIDFSYLHIISDNLSKKFETDLSNERRIDVIENRKKLCQKIGAIITRL